MRKALLCLVLSCLSARAAALPAAEAHRLAATTGVIASVVTEVSGGRVGAAVLMPPGNCPGSFDIRAEHLRLMEQGGVLFAHGFEPYLGRLRGQVRNPAFRLHVFPLAGGWLVPDQQVLLYRAVAEKLAALYPADAALFRANLAPLEKAIADAGAEARAAARAAGLAGAPVLASGHIAGLLEYCGLQVVGVYWNAEDLGPKEMRALVDLGRARGVRLVVDNLQSGEEAGVTLAREIGAARVAISNFPGVFPATPTLRATVQADLERIIAAVREEKKPD